MCLCKKTIMKTHITIAALLLLTTIVHAQNQPTFSQSYNFNTVTGNTWDPHLRIDYDYHSNPDSVFSEIKMYNAGQMTYDNHTISYTINGNDDRFLRSLSKNWVNGNYVNNKKQEKKYSYTFFNGKQNILPHTHLFFTWNDNTNTWDSTERLVYDVDKFNNIVKGYVKQSMWKGTWQNKARFTFQYNYNSLKTSMEIETWISNAWEKSNLQQYSYHGSTSEFSVVKNLRYDKTLKTYVNYIEDRYIYKSNKLDSIVYYHYNSNDNNFQESGYKSFIYDNNGGNLIEEITSNGIKGNSIPNHKVVYSYTNNTSVNEIKNSSDIAYPNPVKNIVNINNADQWVSGKLFDLMGQVVATYNTESFSDNTLDMSTHPNNTYYLLLESKNGKTFSQKLIIEH